MAGVDCCCVCMKKSSNDSFKNSLIFCDTCPLVVHQACYGIDRAPIGYWYCQQCQLGKGDEASKQCKLCPSQNSVLKLANDSAWVHVLCALCIPGTNFENESLEEVIDVRGIPQDLLEQNCYICEEKDNDFDSNVGVCMKCKEDDCQKYFHATCAQSSGLLIIEEQEANQKLVKFVGYCNAHQPILKTNPSASTNDEPVVDTIFDSFSPEKKIGNASEKKSCGSFRVEKRFNGTCNLDNLESNEDDDKSARPKNGLKDDQTLDDSDDEIFVMGDSNLGTLPNSTESSAPRKRQLSSSNSPPVGSPSSASLLNKRRKSNNSPIQQQNPPQSNGNTSTEAKMFSVVKRLDKEELECLVVEKMIAVLTANSTIAALEEKIELGDAALKQYKAKSVKMIKELSDMNKVLYKFVKEMGENNASFKNFVPPLKVTRSVALQVASLSMQLPCKESISSHPSTGLAAPITISNNLPEFKWPIYKTALPSSSSKIMLKERCLNPAMSASTMPKKKVSESFITLESSNDSVPQPSSKPNSDFAKPKSDSDREIVEIDTDETQISCTTESKTIQNQPSPPPLPMSTIVKSDPSLKALPPKPVLKSSVVGKIFKLSWTLRDPPDHAEVASYQIWMYHETSSRTSSTKGQWNAGNLIPARSLPMVCEITISSPPDGTIVEHYHYVVRAIDIHNREGPFSDAIIISYP